MYNYNNKTGTWCRLFTTFVSFFFQGKSKHQGSIQGFTVAMTDTHSSKGTKPMQRTSRYSITSLASHFFTYYMHLNIYLAPLSISSASHVPAHLAEFKEKLAQLSQLDPSTPSVALHTVTTQHNK